MFIKGSKVRVRANNGPWRNGIVTLASDNGRSLAIDLDEATLGARAGMTVDVEGGRSMVLLLLDGEVYRDVMSQEPVEVEPCPG